MWSCVFSLGLAHPSYTALREVAEVENAYLTLFITCPSAALGHRCTD